MKLPRWTVYPALLVLSGILFMAVPRRLPEDPYAGVALADREASVHGAASPTKFPRVVVLGIDGLDPDILREVCAKYPERMTNFRGLIDEADGVQDLLTSTPPQSPVAWSNFITGRNPGGHGVFDFLHRDPMTRGVIPSTTKSEAGEPTPLWGDWQFPASGETASNRSGRPFWQVLGDHGVPADLWRMPINYPVEASRGVSVPGMLTPALDSAYGECSFYTTDPQVALESGYKKAIQIAERTRGRVDTTLYGPLNAMKKGDPNAQVPLTFRIDREAGEDGAVLVEVGGKHVILEPGDWSAFIEVTFSLLPAHAMDMTGQVRFYLRSIEPELEIYASPVNISPRAPASPITEPQSFSAEMAEELGLFYTQGMAEDVNALKKRLLTDPEFMQQADLVFDERVRMMDLALDRYLANEDGGFLFFYYSTVDLCGHMMWRHSDREHPHHDTTFSSQSSEAWSHRPGSTWKDVITDLYLKMDPVLGRLRDRLDPDVALMVISDHGFAPYRRKFALNTWLLEKGYLVLKEGEERELPKGSEGYRMVTLHSVDWEKTRAYGVGFNGLYLNLEGREQDDPKTEEDESGIVQPAEAADLLAELKRELEAIIDVESGERVVLTADLATSVYAGERLAEAPDILVGYNSGYGNSDPASLGRIPHNVLEDNLGGTFNGSHLMDPDVVSGTLLSNRPVLPGQHRLEDITAEILARYGIPPAAGMGGHRVLDIGP